MTAQLGRMFPEEGSLYVWTHKVLGPFWGFFAGFVAWWPGPISLVFIGILFANFLQQASVFIKPSCEFPCLFTENWQIGVVVLARDLVQRVDVLSEDARDAELRERAVLVLRGGDLPDRVRRASGGSCRATAASTDFGTGWNPFQGETLALGLPANLTFFSFAILALLGIETPLNMGAEVTGGEKAIRTFLLWGCLIVMAAYLWATWGNMVVIEAGGANGTTGGAETVGLSLGRWWGAAVSLVMAWVVLTVAVVYNFSFGRLLFVSGMEKRLPHQFGRSTGTRCRRTRSPSRARSRRSSRSSCSSCSALARATRTVLLHPLRGRHDRVVHLDGAALPRHLLREAGRAGAIRTRAAGPDRLPVLLRRRRVRGQHRRRPLHLRGLVVPGADSPTARVGGLERLDGRLHRSSR